MSIKLIENESYIQDVTSVAALELPWNKLENKSLLLSGATGLLGSFLVDVIIYRNRNYNMNTTVYALGRNEERAKERFGYCWEDIRFIPYDVKEPLVRDDLGKIDYVLHLASNTHPVQYATDPIGTITTNIIGVQNMLEFARIHEADRSVFASSNEIYGENRGDVELFKEDYCGYIDSNTLRAGYPESKRCGEALCQAYIKAYDMDIVVPRFTRSYGPTMLMSDTKAISQFIRKAIAGEDIVLKSEGTQYYSYTYVSDAISGLLYILLLGEKGQAYNIADEASDIMLKDLAGTIAGTVGRKVVFELPDAVESAGFSKATKARLDGSKLKELGWKPKYDIKSGMKRNIDILCSFE